MPPVAYVGTTDMGVIKSVDGMAWMVANDGLNMAPGTRLQVNALAVDPVQPNVLYAATSYLMGSTTLHQTSNGVQMSANGADEWSNVVRSTQGAVTDLLPVSGKTGAVYALSNMSRTPLALGVAQVAPQLRNATPVTTPWTIAGIAATWMVVLATAGWLSVLLYAEMRNRVPSQVAASQAITINR